MARNLLVQRIMARTSRRVLLRNAVGVVFGRTCVPRRLSAQSLQLNQTQQRVPKDEAPVEYVCPMDHDVRSTVPGVCPRCGMKLIPGIAERSEYPVELELSPRPLQAGHDTKIIFGVRDPKNARLVRKFEVVHERMFHLFVISQDLETFVHEHPVQLSDGRFEFTYRFPKPALYRVLMDFWPSVGTPQLVEKTLIVSGKSLELRQAHLRPNLDPQQTENTCVEIAAEPSPPVAGQKAMLFVRLTPKEGNELYLGAPAHLLAASDDLIDLIHTHPVQVTDQPDRDYLELQFNVFFPRGTTYRLWIQFQRKGVINTSIFTIPVVSL